MKGVMHTNSLLLSPYASIKHDIAILIIMKTNFDCALGRVERWIPERLRGFDGVHNGTKITEPY